MVFLLSAAVFGQSTAGTERTFRLTYAFETENVPEGARSVRVWVPLPRSNAFQVVRDLEVHCPAGFSLAQDAEYGNSILYVEAGGPLSGSYTVTVTATDWEGYADGGAASPRWLEPDALAPITDRIRAMAEGATQGVEGVDARARGIYEYILEFMEYDGDAPGARRGNVSNACDVRAGNCSDYHALFTAMARAAGIPARFHYGTYFPPERASGDAVLHCWAEYFDGARWVPVDVSEADKHPERAEFFFGRLDRNRVLLTTGRDIVLSPRQAGGPLNFLIRPYVEVDGRPHEGVIATITYASE